jgi:hypothetical protein
VEHAMREWLRRLKSDGVRLKDGPRLTNIRFADDLILYAHTKTELTRMVNTLVQEFGQIGLQLNVDKSKIIALQSEEEYVPQYLRVGGGRIPVLESVARHKYLGVSIQGDATARVFFFVFLLHTSSKS